MKFKYLLILFSILFISTTVYAESAYNLKEITPTVKSALDGRRDRFDLIKVFKQKGEVGENNQGYLTAFNEEAGLQSIVKQENADRKVIYQAIVEQNNLEGALSTVERVFAQEQRDRSEAGEKIQGENGQWGVSGK